MQKKTLTKLTGAYIAARALDDDRMWELYTQLLLKLVPSELPPKKQKLYLLNLHEEVRQACGQGHT
jgi:hypothetical protein